MFMKKIGIVSCYFKDNYGSMLQAYATQKILDNMGLDNETLNKICNLKYKGWSALSRKLLTGIYYKDKVRACCVIHSGLL